ncbi:TBC1 domain family member 10A [Choanephora cucurbitarum]|uniref:TBC1 domain family member 10A n=1 Tax=Choanephora cucurbitarum TaxID=101091 RepID=A0A1C7N9I1_9FUNG|nr:TBC1 domain family member 10A [Choanephora cucurbitarum]
MDPKVTRHISANLEELNEKIAKLLKDPSEIIDNTSFNVDSMGLSELKAFAERGGLGACVSKADVLANSPEELMYLQGKLDNTIIVLKHIEDDIYMGYCEGVVGNFNAENVHFVELDPRVLESLDADLDFATDNSQHRNSMSSYGTDPYLHQHHPQHLNSFRDSLQSVSSGSDLQSQYLQQHHYRSAGKQSFESIGSVHYHHQLQQGSRFSSPSHLDESFSQSDYKSQDPYDTSAFNIDYSDEESFSPSPSPSPVVTDRARSLNRTSNTHSPNNIIHNSNSINNVNNNSSSHISSSSYNDYGDDKSSHISRNSSNSIQQHQQSLNRDLSSPSSTSDGSLPYDKDMVVDEYGFLVKKSQMRLSRSNMSAKSMKEYRENELKWLSIVSKLDAGTVKKDAKFKKLVRNGIPASVRSRVWQFLAGSSEYRKEGQFNKLVRKPHIKIYDVIDRDIARCYPDHTQFLDQHGQGQKDLSCLLKAYAQYNSELEYCQGMGRLAGLMLMHMTVEDSFWLLVATIDRYMNGYFTPTLSQLRIDAYIIGQLLRDHNPKLAQHLEANDVMPIMYIAQWFLTAFTMTLPWESVLRIGIKVFYRVSLAIMELCKDYLLNSCPTNSELLAFLLHIPHKYLEPGVLLETAFRIHLSKTDIKRYAKKACTEDETTSGLPFEDGIKNLQVGGNGSSGGLRSLSGKLSKKGSNHNVKNGRDSFD